MITDEELAKVRETIAAGRYIYTYGPGHFTAPAPRWIEYIDQLREQLRPLAAIADAYDANELDDEARRFWGIENQHENDTPPDRIELYQGRGGRRLLTLADCFAARSALKGTAP